MKRLSIHLLLTFLFGFFVIYFFYAGLPYDFNADILRDEKAMNAVSYSQLFSYTMNPTTPAWFFYPRMEELRPLMYVIHKFFFGTFPGNLFPVHCVVALAHGLLALTFFYIFYWITESKLLSWLLILLYASFPTNGVMLAGYVSLEIQFLLSALELAGMAALILLTSRTHQSHAKKALLILFWLGVTWLAIKWKSSEKILPFVYLAFLVMQFQRVRQKVGARLFALLIAVNISMFVLAVPLKPVQPVHSKVLETNAFVQKEKQMTRFHLSTFFSRTFSLPGEENPFLAVCLDESPASFTGNLGFFLGWFFWLGLILVGILRIRSLPGSLSKSLELRFHAMTLALFWFLAVVAGFGAGKFATEVRYLNYAFVPSVVLIAFLIRLFQEILFRSSLSKKISTLVFSGMILFTAIQNYGFLSKWVGFYGGIQDANFRTGKWIYQSIFQKEPHGMDLLRRHGELEDRFTLVSWYDLKPDWFEQAKLKLQEEEVLFVKSRGAPDEKLDRFRKEGFRVEPVAHFSFYDAKPLFFKLSKFLVESRLKKFKDLQVALYKIT